MNRCHFFSKRKTGPVTLYGEYASIIRQRSLVKDCSGLSSAWKMDGCLMPMSRAASARVRPAAKRCRFASAASALSSTIMRSFMPDTLQEIV